MPHRNSRPTGKRQDMPNWFEDDNPRQRNPILLMAAARISDDAGLATQAIDLARGYFALAQAVYPDGRDNNAGVVTDVLGCMV